MTADAARRSRGRVSAVLAGDDRAPGRSSVGARDDLQPLRFPHPYLVRQAAPALALLHRARRRLRLGRPHGRLPARGSGGPGKLCCRASRSSSPPIRVRPRARRSSARCRNRISAGTRARCLAAGVTPLQGQREALEALDHAATIGAAWARGATVELCAAPARSARAAPAARARTLPEHEGKAALAAYGVPDSALADRGKADKAARSAPAHSAFPWSSRRPGHSSTSPTSAA